MPFIHNCLNYDTCKGIAVNGTKHCQHCLEVAEQARLEKQDERTLKRLETKPRRLSDVLK